MDNRQTSKTRDWGPLDDVINHLWKRLGDSLADLGMRHETEDILDSLIYMTNAFQTKERLLELEKIVEIEKGQENSRARITEKMKYWSNIMLDNDWIIHVKPDGFRQKLAEAKNRENYVR